MSADFIVEREKSFIPPGKETRRYIDLWIEDDNNIIVIENKIRSGINGINEDGSSSQLIEYYDFAHNMAKYKNKDAYFYIFAPEYNQLKLDDQSNEKCFVKVTYQVLYDFFNKHKKEYINRDPYFDDFLIGLNRHTKTMSDLNFEIMRDRFSDKLRKHKPDHDQK